MRPTSHLLKQGWIYLLFWLFCTGSHAASGAATTPPNLRDVKIIYQNESWQVVLSGSGFTTYKAMKFDDPLRLVLDLPNTTSNRVSFRKILDNGIVDTIDTLVFVHGTQPLARVVIGLYEDISYEISQSPEEIRVTLGAPILLSQEDSSPGETAPGASTELNPVETQKARVDPPLDLPGEKSGYSTRDAGKSNFPPASKLLEIRAVEVDEKLLISIVANGSLDRHRAFQLTNPPRLVVDLMGVGSTEVKNVLNLYGPLIDKIRLGLPEGRLRVVFDLIPPMGLPYRVVSGNDRLQVSFMPGSGFPPAQPNVQPPAASREEGESVPRFVEP